LLIVCLFQIGLMGCGAQEPNYTIASWHYVFKNPATPDHLIPVEIYYPSESRLKWLSFNGFWSLLTMPRIMVHISIH